MISKVLRKVKSTLKTVNGYALNRTEEVVSEGIVVVDQWQGVANKALKEGLSLAETNQDLIFDALTGVKEHIVLSKKRFSKLVG